MESIKKIKYRCLSRKSLFMVRIVSETHIQVYCVDNKQSYSAEPGGEYIAPRLWTVKIWSVHLI
jgi:hypothetical protein